MELGVHLPLMPFGEEPLSLRRLEAAVDAAREYGFAAVAANDHLVFQTPWLDGPTALASMIERSGSRAPATTISLAALRGPVPVAKALAAIDVLSGCRLTAGVGPGSSARDYRVLGIAFEERWARFDDAVAVLRALLGAGEMPEHPRFYAVPPDTVLAPAPLRRDGIRCGSGAEVRGRVSPASPGSVTAGWRRPPTRRPSASATPGPPCVARSRSGAGRRTAPQCAGDDVDMGLRGPAGGGPPARRRPRPGPGPGSRRAPQLA